MTIPLHTVDETHKKSRISMVVAIGKNRVIGKNNELLWPIPDDLKRFKTLTNGHPVIMGRKTWKSLPEKFRPLPGRINIVITRQNGYEAKGAVVVQSLEAALAAAASAEGGEEIFIMGGAQIYTEALPFTSRLYLTLIEDEKAGDVFFPPYESEFTKVISEETRNFNGLIYHWRTLER